MEAETSTRGTRTFDGVICFGGGDWWYHNRGHYDLQMMRSFHRRVPVLYVNSIGIRVPKVREGAMSLRRVARKLRSLSRGFTQVDEAFAVTSPIVVPGQRGMALSRRLLGPQVRRHARRLGIRRPLVWVTCPPGVEALPQLEAVAVIYERTDRWESFPEADAEQILDYHGRLQQTADLTLYASTLLFEEEAANCRNAAYVDHGVDYERFAEEVESEPSDMRDLGRPRAGFIGGIDALTFDAQLLVETARRLPDVQFPLVGGCSLPQGWGDLPNVHLLGQKPYEEVPAYMAACDALLMPWNNSEWIRACNPVKLKEYLATGRPIVSTAFHELRRYEGYVRVASGADEFSTAIRAALAHPPRPEHLRARVREETWQAKFTQVLTHLEEAGLTPA